MSLNQYPEEHFISVDLYDSFLCYFTYLNDVMGILHVRELSNRAPVRGRLTRHFGLPLKPHRYEKKQGYHNLYFGSDFSRPDLWQE